MLVGASMAIHSNEIKTLLAFSGISQVGYVLVMVGVGTRMTMFAGLFHLLNVAISKSIMFLSLDNTSRLMRWAFFLAAISIIGLPPTFGFATKWAMYTAILHSRDYLIGAFLLLTTLLTLAYCTKAFCILKVEEAWTLLPISILCILLLGFGIFPSFLSIYVSKMVGVIFGGIKWIFL
jgi:formate hydrogenlyase subunit 3/multisubunit Na+/H+ antiporter MnhD subunit